MLKTDPSIDVVITDYSMPFMDGLAFVREARRHHHGMRYFMLSGYDMRPEVRDAITHGELDGYFHKPMSISKILAALSAEGGEGV